MAFTDGEFEWQGHRLAYSDYGEGERALVLMHGLLMNRRMFDRLAPEMASRGNRVITRRRARPRPLRPARRTCASTTCPRSASSSRR